MIKTYIEEQSFILNLSFKVNFNYFMVKDRQKKTEQFLLLTIIN